VFKCNAGRLLNRVNALLQSEANAPVTVYWISDVGVQLKSLFQAKMHISANLRDIKASKFTAQFIDVLQQQRAS